MYFKGDIIITDSCYVIKNNPYEYPHYWDYNLDYKVRFKSRNEYTTPDELAYLKAKDLYEKYNDWDKCDCGDNMEVLGINTYINESTLYGDWSCTTYLTVENDIKDIVNDISKCIVKINKSPIQSLERHCLEKEMQEIMQTLTPIGEFCADAGMVGVFLLDEILKYNPDFKKWMEEHPWCVTCIKDFEGDIDYYVDDNTEAHIIGKGNINFLTIQTGA